MTLGSSGLVLHIPKDGDAGELSELPLIDMVNILSCCKDRILHI